MNHSLNPRFIHNFFIISILLLIIRPLFATESLIPTPPAINASSYLLMDASSGKIIMSKNADQAIPPASLTKIMTSYVTEYELSKGNIQLDDQVPISVKAWRKAGSKMYVKEGTKVLLSDLLKGVIIQSGNDASIALAEYIAGSEDAFADLMNKHAARLGMTNTHFVNATGWPSKNHYSTAQDLALLSQALIEDFPEHYGLYAEKSFTYNDITQPNRNTLLHSSDNVDGIKTGHTEEAGYCLVASAFENGMRLISVITGTDSDRARAQESRKMLTYGFRFYETKKVYSTEIVITTQHVWKGQTKALDLVSSKDVYLTYPRGQYEDLSEILELPQYIEAPINTGDKIGKLNFKLGDEVMASTPLIAKAGIARGGFFGNLWDSIRLFFAQLFS